MLRFLCILLVCLACSVRSETTGASASIKPEQVKQMKEFILAAHQPDGSFGSVEDTHFAVASLLSFQSSVPDKTKTCAYLASKIESSDDIDSLYHAVSAADSLKCLTSKLGKAASKAIHERITNEKETVEVTAKGIIALLKTSPEGLTSEDLLAAALAILSQKEDNGTFLNGEGEAESSIYAAGVAFHALGFLASKTELDSEQKEGLEELINSANSLFESYQESEHGISYVDNGDSRTALKVSSSLLRGVNVLASYDSEIAFPKDFTGDLAEYFVHHIPVVGPISDIYYFATGIEELTSSAIKNPLVVELPSASIASGTKGSESFVKVRVTDIWGHSVDSVKVFMVSATAHGEDSKPLASNQELFPVANSKDLYQFNFMVARPEPGFYELEFSVTPENEKSRFLPVSSAVRALKVQTTISVPECELKVVDTADESVLHQAKIQYGKTVDHIRADIFHRVHFSFQVKNPVGALLQVQQVFVRLSTVSSSGLIEAIFVAEPRPKRYVLTINMGADGERIRYESGVYKMELIVGDAFARNPIKWDMGEITLTFPSDKRMVPSKSVYSARPEITHKFRPQENRPPAGFSILFTGLVLAPLGLLVLGLLVNGVNIYNFPTSVSGLVNTFGFLAAFGAILFVLVQYFLWLNMFQTLYAIGPLGLVAVFFGRGALRQHYIERTKKKKD